MIAHLQYEKNQYTNNYIKALCIFNTELRSQQL